MNNFKNSKISVGFGNFQARWVLRTGTLSHGLVPSGQGRPGPAHLGHTDAAAPLRNRSATLLLGDTGHFSSLPSGFQI